MHCTVPVVLVGVSFSTLALLCNYWRFVPPDLIRQWLYLPPAEGIMATMRVTPATA